MPTGFESTGAKALIDAIVYLVKGRKNKAKKTDAEKALSKALRKLLTAPSETRSIELAIRQAIKAGIDNEELDLAQELLTSTKVALKKKGKKLPARRKASKKKKSGKQVSKKKASKKKRTKKKAAKKKSSRKKRAKKKSS